MPYAPFKPPAIIRNTHLQNVLSTSSLRRNMLNRRYHKYISEQKTLILDAGNGVKLSADLNTQPNREKKKLIVLLHGWEGSSRSAYIVSLAGKLAAANYDTLRLNFRDHGDSHHLNRGLFNSTLLEEVIGAVEYTLEIYGYDDYAIAGFSLGGNFALRYGLKNTHLAKPASAIFSVCPVLDPAHTMVALESNWSLYEQYFVKKWKRSLENKLQHFPDYKFKRDLSKLQTLKDMNDYFIPEYTGYKDVTSYFNAYTLTGSALSFLNVPTLIVAAKDDPVNPFEDFSKIAQPEKLKILTTEHGSHCAFLENMQLDSWVDNVALQFLGDQ